MKNISLVIISLCFFSSAFATGASRFDRFDEDDEGYTLLLPHQPPKGLIIISNNGRKKEVDYPEGLRAGFAVMYPAHKVPLEFYFTNEPMDVLDDFIQEVSEEFSIPSYVFLVGWSLGGTRMLRYAQYCKQGLSKNGVSPRGVVIIDSPLDMVRFYKECEKKAEFSYKESSAWEGKLVVNILKRNLGGAPLDHLENYITYSPYCYIAEDGGNVRWLQNIAIRAYHEPDINWWIDNRRQDYYGINSLDDAALINELLKQGNQEAELITTQNEGYREDGTRHPHSWIVDDRELVQWMINKIEPKP